VEWVGKEECFVYYGIRADEERQGFNNTLSPNIIPVYPLKEHGITLKGVYIIINNAGLKPPQFFWKSVYAEVARILGYLPGTVLPEWLYDMLFAWRSRANCYFCFNQRLYELVGLAEHHPDLFWKAESYEHLGGEKIYTWNSNKSMQQIYDEREVIKKKRIDYIVKFIRNNQQLSLYETSEDFYDVLGVKSCGLFCGK
jgi:hypothetical protein